MKKSCLLLLTLLVGAIGASAWGACPQDTLDRGNCDTIYIEPWQDDLIQFTPGTGPYYIRVPIYVTSDLADACDSINAFVIPLCYTHSNPTKYCSLSAYWNVPFSFTNPRSMFRHLDGDTNRMMWLDEQEQGGAWDTRLVKMTSDSSWAVWETGWPDPYKDSVFVPPHIWMSFVPTGGEDQRWWEGSRVLLATLTFKLEDSMQICIDTCWWPPLSNLAWGVSAESSGVCLKGITKMPRPGTGDSSSYRVCFNFNSSDVREVNSSDQTRPSGFSLSQNYPNPFNPITNFQFSLSKASHVKIEIFNIVGQKVKVLVNEDMRPGVYMADWNSKDDNGKTVSSGIYFYRMQAGEYTDVKKMVLMK